ncbi:MAG: hypothetical protein AVDCRST_MAG87-799 [uncultured Thermomicrobiales bacterium]|uniref:Uncharacterized protein n=1 Tax=uncultured Thermomicrobiales bacterium TaxID=1645740 RepID=A0A6J4UGH6_9BACT|nr:MAG: hypothetical protein AVDCRST_MAG87-799 [uncultured Thermomicrobiales bacterium]
MQAASTGGRRGMLASPAPTPAAPAPATPARNRRASENDRTNGTGMLIARPGRGYPNNTTITLEKR